MEHGKGRFCWNLIFKNWHISWNYIEKFALVQIKRRLISSEPLAFEIYIFLNLTFSSISHGALRIQRMTDRRNAARRCFPGRLRFCTAENRNLVKNIIEFRNRSELNIQRSSRYCKFIWTEMAYINFARRIPLLESTNSDVFYSTVCLDSEMEIHQIYQDFNKLNNIQIGRSV